MFVTQITCFACGRAYPHSQPINLCECGKPLRVDYDLEAVGRAVKREDLVRRSANLWRYREVLPLPFDLEPPTLGEGFTPIIPADSLADTLGMKKGHLLIKDEGVNPTEIGRAHV